MWIGRVIWFFSFNDSICLLLLLGPPTVISDKYNPIWMTAKSLHDSMLARWVGTDWFNLFFLCVYVFILIFLTYRYIYNTKIYSWFFLIWIVRMHIKNKSIGLERHSVVEGTVCSSRVSFQHPCLATKNCSDSRGPDSNV